MPTLLSERPIPFFLTYSFLVSWICWFSVWLVIYFANIPYGHPITIALLTLGGLAPFLIVLITYQYYHEGWEKVKDSLWNPEMHYKWWFIAILLTLLVSSLPLFVELAFEGRFGPLFNGIYLLWPSILIFAFLGALEQIAWRGYLLPHYLKQMSPAQASIRVGILFGLLHIPQWYLIGVASNASTLLAMFIHTLAISYLFTAFWMIGKNTAILIFMDMLLYIWFLVVSEGDMSPLITSIFECIFCFIIFVWIVQQFTKDENPDPVTKPIPTNQPGQTSGNR